MIGDQRGILHPARLPEFHRLPPLPGMEELIRWFWISEWEITPERVSRQEILAFHACNLVVEHDVVGISGPSTRRSHKDLVGTGWAVAALLRPAAVPALVGDPTDLVDDYRTWEPTDPEVAELHRAVTTAMSGERSRDAAVEELARWMTTRVGVPSPEALLANRLADLAESRSEITNVEELAADLAVSVRTTQRLSRTFIGRSPSALIRRRRLQEATERIRDHPDTDLAGIAHELGFTDHAHLCAEFRSVLGFTPSGYRGAVEC